MAEAADFLLALGVTDAVNLDGGGGTTFVVGGSCGTGRATHLGRFPAGPGVDAGGRGGSLAGAALLAAVATGAGALSAAGRKGLRRSTQGR